jgi:hypothetical protein
MVPLGRKGVDGREKDRCTSKRFMGLRSKADQCEGSKPRQATSDECAVHLVTKTQLDPTREQHAQARQGLGVPRMVWRKVRRVVT